MNKGLCVSLLLCVLFSLNAQAFQLGALDGQVRSSEGQPLSKVTVSVEPGGKTVLTGSNGRFRITGLSMGDYTLTFSYIGHGEETLSAKVSGAFQTLPLVELTPTAELELLVIGSLREGQAKAINEQRLAANIKNIIAADQIGNFPDTNAAEATQRVPGVNIARDQGEGRYVLVRGTEPRLNKTVMNGVDLPAPEGDLRTVALDVIPINLLEAIEITKANTPDMDGDSVGGAVNLVTRTASMDQKVNLALDYGYNELSETDLYKGELTYGRRFNDGRFGMLATYSFEDTDRATDNFEAAYDDGELEELELRDYEVNRKRLGGHLALDYQPNSRVHYYLNASHTQFDDQEYRRRITYVPGDNEIERELKDRFETQSITSIQHKANIFTDNGGTFKYNLAYSYARESEPGRVDSTFKAEDIDFAPSPFDPGNIQLNPQNEDVGAFEFDDITREDNNTNDEHTNLELSYEWPVAWGSDSAALIKIGAKYRAKQKERDIAVTKFEQDDVFLADLIDRGYVNEDLFDNRYQMGAMPDATAMRNLLAGIAEGEIDFEEDAGDYKVEENLTAAYAMATIDFNDNFMLLPGFRFERIDADYTGYEVDFDAEGDFVGTSETRGSNEDDIFLPMLHMRYKFADESQMRAAVTRSYARARVYDQVPYRLLLREDNEIEEGNPDIEITSVWNLDLTYERYFGDAGLFTIGVFYKDMTDIIFTFKEDRDINGEEFEVTRPVNGDEATMTGAEIAFQTNFTSLPAPFDGLGVYFNYTWTDSEADFLDRKDFILPGQAEEMGNLALIYEKWGFSGRISGNLHDQWLDEVGGDPSEDVFIDRHFQWDLNLSYRWDKIKFVLEVINLNNEPFVIFEENANRPIQYEEYKRWARLGVRIDF